MSSTMVDIGSNKLKKIKQSIDFLTFSLGTEGIDSYRFLYKFLLVPVLFFLGSHCLVIL